MALRAVLALLGILSIGFAQSASAAPVTLAVHVLVACPIRGVSRPVKVPGLEAALCLDPPFLTHKDVESAEFHRNSKGRPVVFLTFHEDAAVRELEITRKNIGSRVSIVVNGRIVSTPSISASSRFLYIDANYTAVQVQTLVAAFNKQAGNP